MTPKEILGMVEEATGTRMYKTKREQSLKVLEKKDLKLLDVNKQLNEEFLPKVERLRQQKAYYLELQKCARDIETLARQDTAHKFHQYKVWLFFKIPESLLLFIYSIFVFLG